MPKQPETLKPGHQSAKIITEFFEKGYLVVEDFFSTEELDPCLDALEEIVDDVANAIHEAGNLSDLHKDKDVFTRLIKIDEQFPGALVMTHKHSRLPPAFQNLWGNERLLNFMEQILGPRVCANPIWNIRPKAPGHPDGEIPWHQDSGYFDPASYGTLLPVVWVPLLDVTAENGCLQGYLVVEDFFSTEELDPCLDALEEIVDDVANAIHEAGNLSDLHKDKDVFTRLIKIDEQFPGALVMTHKHSRLPPAFQNLWGNERLLNFMEQILGPRVCANPIWNIRPKAPGHPDGEIPWHQDSGYFDPASYGTLLPVVWVPLLDVTAENGCLQVIEGGHLKGVVSDHLNYYANTWHVMLDEEKMEEKLDISVAKDVKTLPVKKGGFVIFNNLVPHRSHPNKSDKIRWSLDLRFQRPGEPEGLYGAMPLVPLRDPAAPDLVPDWAPYASTRHNAQPDNNDKDCKTSDTDKPVKDLDTIITGPWMKQWPLVNSNKHTEAYGLRLETADRGI